MRCRMIATILLALAGGCGGGTGQPYVTEPKLSKGLVIVLTGIHGRLWISQSICQGLEKGGVDAAIEVYDWTYQGKLLPFYNLMACQRNHEVAKEVARHIVEYQKQHPGCPVTLVGYSGGGPLAVWTAEALPRTARLAGLILLSTPLVPEYDLGPALAVCDKGIVSFYSNRDILYLGVGTLVFGTMDGKHKVSAGNLAFIVPQDPRRRQAYQRLHQLSYRSEWDKLGYSGSHLTIGAEDFIATCIAPLVTARNWDPAVVEQAVSGRLAASRPATRGAAAGK